MQRFVKILLIIAGTISLFLGVLGIILPLLPTTPFLLLSAACYIKGSEKLYQKLINSPYLGIYIRNFREKKGMPLKAKYYTIILLWLSLSVSLYITYRPYLLAILPIVGIGVTILILKIKTLEPESKDSIS